MFEITRDDIAALNDEDLRALIGRLCEAELRRKDLPVSAVTWGGDQTAKDGGLDVRVALAPGTHIQGFVPRAATGFQVKKPDMPAAEIIKEMKPKGVLRPVIEELAAACGAYVIVSSNGSTSDSALKSRGKAMADAMQGCSDAAKLHLEFYDRSRVASWVRDHAGLIPWVRSRIGRAFRGWQSYGGWSPLPAGADNTYLLDDKARIKTTGQKDDDADGVTVVDGIDRMRDALRNPGQVVRLVGLSGVGKTRLVEALFDPMIGTKALDPSLAIYADTAHEPDPQPRGLASDLLAQRTRAILVVDNCPFDTHRQLAEVARIAGSTISVITIEYDFRDDQPEGTDVFSLETSSLPLIEKLVRARFRDISQIDARTIAEFSDGNARIALALAGTLKKTETISGLTNTELFTRLFQQRHSHDANLLQIAEACSLVYSFQGEALEGENAELPILGRLIGRSAQDVFAAAAELKRRDLLQQRREWRAVLPHAIANRLAKLALENIPYPLIRAEIVEGPSERLLRSFSRRLGYLNDSKQAQDIVRGWLSKTGLLADVLELNELGRAMFENVAPVAPEATLSALENVFGNADRLTLLRGGHLIRLLHSLAYDTPLFERAVRLLIAFASVLEEGSFDGEAARATTPLFYPAFSGTHAPLAVRLPVVKRLLKSEKPVEQYLGIQALEALMTTHNFAPYGQFEFGARSRNYGYHPKSGAEAGRWFEDVLSFVEPFALGDSPITARVRKSIAHKFRWLWTHGGRHDALERIAKSIAGGGFWRDGWVATRQTHHYDGKSLTKEAAERLTRLEEFLRPKDLVNRVRAIVLGDRSGRLTLDDLGIDDQSAVKASERMRRSNIAAEKLGRDVAMDDAAFSALLPELVSAPGNLSEFGRGLALEALEPRLLWRRLVDEVSRTDNANVQVLLGILSGLEVRESAQANALLDEAVDDPILAPWLPTLQTGVTIDDKGVARLRRALDLGKAPIGQYFSLVYGGVCEPIPGPAFRDLVLAIGAKPDGNRIALEILAMRLHSNATAKRTPLPESAEAGRQLLVDHRFTRRGNAADSDDYRLGLVAAASLAGAEGASITRKLLRDLKEAVARYDVSAGEQDDLLLSIFKKQPVAALDELASGEEKDRQRSTELIQDMLRNRQSPSSVVPDDVLLSWCEADPARRYPFAAGVALLYSRPNDQSSDEWKPIAKLLLERAPDPVAVFEAMGQRIWPTSFDGSPASKFESRMQLLDILELGENAALRVAVGKFRGELADEAARWRQRDLEEDSARSGRFE
ncbi:MULTISPECIES: hypothetical protein [unclassified Bradyrhizobium]|uniref:hypothetical protein n=1 Tax=unclassified Bradyrhizobium TaxID=2631580 RepID=UPI0007159310|nr:MULTISPECIES: hypothetical protein [unclassified Bradyrhizobium]KQT23518.1 hypothetical protein ASG57_23995 [Bradyrhizobium sp. Leaf396]